MTKIAIFDLTDCEGCELQFLTLKEKLLDFFQDFDVLNWRLLQENKKIGHYDLAFVTGTPVKEEERKFLKTIRERTKYLVAVGNCAVTGGIPALVKQKDRKRLTEYVYGKNYKSKATEAYSLSHYVKVDKEIPGCPVAFSDLEKFIQEIPNLVHSAHTEIPSGPCHFVPDYVTKIEGHGTLKVSLKDSHARLDVEEGERLIEGILLERDFKEAPFITSRICGICPIVHNLTAIKAMENALGIKPNDVVISLRKVLIHAQIIHSHIFHLFFLALPDYMNHKSGIELAKTCPAEFHLILNLKRTSEKILEMIGGRAIHPTLTSIGGFLQLPEKDKLFSLLNDLNETIDEAENLVQLFAGLKYPEFERKREFLATKGRNGYELYEGDIVSNEKKSFLPREYKEEIKEELKPHSTAKFGRRNGNGFMVGALARLNLHQDSLNNRTKKLLAKSVFKFPSQNPFHNNLAQAIEVLHLYEESVKELEKLISLNDAVYQRAGTLPKIQLKAGQGVGCVEAPRGTLYHYYEIDGAGKIKNCDIITPTVQNLSCVEPDVQKLLQETKGQSKKERVQLLEMLVRAYDPCITCSVH